jgi:hypothetical protein
MFRYVGIVGLFFVWLAHLELSPRLGNIWLRRDAEGVLRFSPGGLKALFVAPWHTRELWSPLFWDVNPWPVLASLSILGVLWHLWGTATPLLELPPHLHEDDKRSL